MNTLLENVLVHAEDIAQLVRRMYDISKLTIIQTTGAYLAAK